MDPTLAVATRVAGAAEKVTPMAPALVRSVAVGEDNPR